MTFSEKIGFLFPGQGAQSVGMGKDLHDGFPQARKVFEQADAVLGYSLRKICFEGPEEELTRTLYAQPAIYTHSYAALLVLREKYPDLTPSFAAGLSLGEFSALTAAGSIAFEDGLKLVQIRAEAMEEAAKNHPGTMASILGLSPADCEGVARDAGCEVANLNSPEQIVLSGTAETIEKACALAEQRGAKRALRLKVGGAFHSSLMADARERLTVALRSTPIRPPHCAFIPNAKAAKVSDPEEIRELLSRQLTSPVRWVETMLRAKESGLTHFLEIGPGKVLKGLVKKSHPEFQIFPCGTAADLEKLESAGSAVETKDS
ncbi:MAG TPA: ACP S-malonyltransferase [Verrucomicrobiae bacterium]|nr:ACP S-malonyltransferase [Verrucomicrobiae bacterium]